MKTVLKAIWNALKSNLVMKIMALLFAVILWSYVLSIINPERTRTVPNIPVRYENMSHLTDNQFQISKSLSDELGKVKVSVVLKQSELKIFSDKNIDAYVDLSYVTGPGDYPIQVQAKLLGVTGHVQDIPMTPDQSHGRLRLVGPRTRGGCPVPDWQQVCGAQTGRHAGKKRQDGYGADSGPG
jgi:hypothetical protein